MARTRRPRERKLRTREHILADLSMNYVERQILLRGFAVNRLHTDYGIDLLMLTNTDDGEIEVGQVLFQVKATDSLQVVGDGQDIACRIEVADLNSWRDECMPVILVLYDGQDDRAYWLYVQEYFDDSTGCGEDRLMDQDSVTVRIPKKNRLGRKAIERFRHFRDQRVKLMKGASNGS